jgi:hypothetical protein
MRWTTKAAFVAAGSLGAAAGGRADDAPDATQASIVFAAGDRVHGHLRGGETHVLQVPLAKGDVYSFSVAVAKADLHLLLHLSFVDPTGREINAPAHVVHAAAPNEPAATNAAFVVHRMFRPPVARRGAA